MSPRLIAVLLVLAGPAGAWTYAARLPPDPGAPWLTLEAGDRGHSALTCGASDTPGAVDLWLARAASPHDDGEPITVSLRAGSRTVSVSAGVRRVDGLFNGIVASLPLDHPFWADVLDAPALVVGVPGLAPWSLPLDDFAALARQFLDDCRSVSPGRGSQSGADPSKGWRAVPDAG